MKKTRRRHSWYATTTCIVLIAGIGCSKGPSVGHVRGTVTVDGEPMPGLTVLFYPENGRASLATTDEQGNYELQYKPGVRDTPAGPYKIVITSATEEEPVERIPLKYNKNTELTALVEPGANQINFDIDTK